MPNRLSSPRITALTALHVGASWEYDVELTAKRFLRPLDIYPEFRAPRAGWPVPNADYGSPYEIETFFLRVETDCGVSGLYGPIPRDEMTIITNQLAPVVVGQDAFATARIWDRMYRSAIHGRKGTTLMAISKVDLALWDLKGKLLDAPVHRLIGGPSREAIPAYASMLGFSVEPDEAAVVAAETAALGYLGQKWFFGYGSFDGPEGLRQNVSLVAAVREAVGPDVEIMFDAWNSWDVAYTRRMAEAIRPYRVAWIEEPVMPDQIDQYVALRGSLGGIPISGGEHEYTRWGFEALLSAGAIDVLQPDPTWSGGLSEMLKICAMASARSVPVVFHHGAWASTHLIAAHDMVVCPMQEWILQCGARDNSYLKHKIVPVEGMIAVPEWPGLGIELDESTITFCKEAELR